MELRDYVRVIRRGWLIILALALIGTAAGVGLTVATRKVYQASVQLFVATSSADTQNLSGGNTFTQDRVQSYISIADSPPVAEAVIKQLSLTLSPGALANKISADAPANKVLVNLHVTDTNAVTAATLANAVGQQFSSFVEKTDVDASGNALVRLTVIRPAQVPSTPIKPNPIINIGFGLVIGLLLGLGLVVLRATLDNTVKSVEDFEKLGLALLGSVPLDKRASNAVVAFREDAHSGRSEAYRQIRTNLQFVDVDHPPRLIAVTSAVPGEGKTMTSINLASALAEAGFRVCLVDADLRRPSIASKLGLIGDVGFTTVLISDLAVEEALQNAGRNLAVLTAGQVPPNPSELLISEQARAVISGLAEQVDFVVIDTPPLLPVSDGAEIATIVDATILVVRAGKTTRDQAQRAVDNLTRVGEKPVGAIASMVSRRRDLGGDYGYYGGYYAYSPRRDSKDTPKRRGAAADPAPAEPVVEPAADTTVSTDVDATPADDAAATTAEPSRRG